MHAKHADGAELNDLSGLVFGWRVICGLSTTMVLWRLSGRQHANSFDGGNGLLFDGRWNTVGHAVAVCSGEAGSCRGSGAVAGIGHGHL
jgi:hypothetical protein